MKCKSYDELFFTDDFLFSKIMRDPKIAKGLIENLLGLKIGKIEFLCSQYTIDEVYHGRGVRLDAYLENSDKIIDIEMQTVLHKDEGLRMRYYQSIIDIEHMNKGQNYHDMKESYILFLCLEDPFGFDLPVYNFQTKESKTNLILNDKMHKIIYNASSFSKAKDKNVRAVLEFLKNKNPTNSLTKQIQNAIEISKNKQPWRADYMLWRDQVNEWKYEARKEGLAEGRTESKLDSAVITVKEFGIPPEAVAEKFNIKLEDLQHALENKK